MAELDEASQLYRPGKWDVAYGSSGTIGAIAEILTAAGQTPGIITRQGLEWLKSRLVRAKYVDNLQIETLKEERKPVLAGGLAVLIAIFDVLQISEMQHALGALRQGVMYDLLDREQPTTDLRNTTVNNLMQKFAVDNAQATRVALQRSRTAYEHAVALLVGEAPAGFAVAPAPWVHTVPRVPAELPSLLLLRRPDVASAERAVTAANAQIGVARSAYFPNLNLSASLGAGGVHLADLVSAPSLLWSIGLALAQNIFDGGAREARVEQTLAARDAAVARYRQAALTSMKEVEDQLSALATLAAQTEHVRAAADAAERIEQQQMNRYQAGLTSYTEVVQAQASALSARRSLLQLQLQRQQAAVGLIQALGGGWQVPWVVERPIAPLSPAAPRRRAGCRPTPAASCRAVPASGAPQHSRRRRGTACRACRRC